MASAYTILGAQAAPDWASPEATSPIAEAEVRRRCVDFLARRVGLPYLWGGKDPDKGLDCSGAVMAAYESVGLARTGAAKKYGSADLHRTLRCIGAGDAKPGDCVFYGKDGKVSHVMLYAGDGRVIGATGGGPRTTSPTPGAAVQWKPVNYRGDLIGYGQAPFGVAFTGPGTAAEETGGWKWWAIGAAAIGALAVAGTIVALAVRGALVEAP